MFRIIGSLLLVVVIVLAYMAANSESSTTENGDATAPVQQPVNDKPSKNFNL